MSYRSLVLAVAAFSSMQVASADAQSVYVAPGGVYIGAGPVYVVPAPNKRLSGGGKNRRRFSELAVGLAGSLPSKSHGGKADLALEPHRAPDCLSRSR